MIMSYLYSEATPTCVYTPEEGRNDAGVNEREEGREAVPLPLDATFLFWLCCQCLLHPETHGHKYQGTKLLLSCTGGKKKRAP